MDKSEAARKTIEECQTIIGHQQKRIEVLEEKERLSDNIIRIEAEERNKALAKVTEQQEADRIMAIEIQEEERRQSLLEQQEANWLTTVMDWDQQFGDDYGFLPTETGANLNTTFLKHPCKKCDKNILLKSSLRNIH